MGPRGSEMVCDAAPSRPLPARQPLFRGARVGFYPVPTRAEMACEINQPLPAAAPPRHPPVEALKVEIQDEPFPNLDGEAASICSNAHCASSAPYNSGRDSLTVADVRNEARRGLVCHHPPSCQINLCPAWLFPGSRLARGIASITGCLTLGL